MNYLQIDFETINEGEAEILVALLADAGFESFEETENSLLAFIKEDGFEENSLEEILKIIPVNYAITVVPQQNWNAQWESSFEPIIVNNFVGIRAAFHQPIKDVKHEIIITPKMSFGTGHHATTYMMIEQMEGLDFAGKSVIDFGTGTAVLAILAEKMGAVAINAIDCDEWSIENSIENAASNNCTNINLIKAETIATGAVYDFILANINLNVIMANLHAIIAVSQKGTFILLSGFIKADEAEMKQALSANGIETLKAVQTGEWICILAEMG
ncbi:MAG: 50S ribosomal protein L11 methyltransferase [Ferruginibacter sp.]